MKNILNKMLAGVLIGTFALAPMTFAKRSLEAYGTDTMAGKSSLLTTTATEAEIPVEFIVTRPGGGQLFLPAETDISGVARTDLYGYHTKVAGQYTVAVREALSDEVSQANVFEVLAGNVSDTYSVLEVSEDTADANGSDKIYATVKIMDEYQNPLADRNVNLISSRSDDNVKALSNGTDENGEARFAVSSYVKGISTLSAVDTMSGTVLSERVRVIFAEPIGASAGGMLSASFLGNVRAADLNADLTQNLNGEVAGFTITKLAPTLRVNETDGFLLTAVDDAGNVVTNYQGEVYFTSSDPEATYPLNYEFTASDLGSHEFELGVMFQTKGTQTITATDKSDPSISEIASVIVTDEDGPEGSIVLTAPIEGEYTDTTLEVKGEGPVLADIRIFDGKNLLKTVGSDSAGAFSYVVENLVEGVHKFSANTEEGLESNVLEVTINTSGAKIIAVYTKPESPVIVESDYEIFLESEPNLAKVQAVVNRMTYTLVEDLDNPGTYSKAAIAPEVADSYPIDVKIEDSLGNVTSEKNADTLIVNADQALMSVYGAKATGMDSSVEVSWVKTDGASGYRINYSIDPENLNEVALVADVDTDVIEGLENGRLHFFTITALDEDGADMTGPSETVSATPFGGFPVLNLVATAGEEKVDLDWTRFEDAAKYKISVGYNPNEYFASFLTADAENTVEITDLVANTKYYFTIEAASADDEIISLPAEEAYATPWGKKPVLSLVAEAGEGEVGLTWESFAGAEHYQIFVGVASGDYFDTGIVTEDASTEMTVTDLVNGKTYYFLVVALDGTQTAISLPSNEASATPFQVLPECIPMEVDSLTGEGDKEGNVFLSWEYSEYADSYAIYYRTAESDEAMTLLEIVGGGQTSWEGAFEEGEYEFAVKTVCPELHEASMDFERSVQVKTGPALIIIAMLSLTFALSYRKLRLIVDRK